MEGLPDVLKLVNDPVYIVLLIIIYFLIKMIRDRDKLMFGYIESLSKIKTLLQILVYGKDYKDDKER